MNWEYILASKKPRKNKDLSVYESAEYYSFPELIDQFNKEHSTDFVTQSRSPGTIFYGRGNSDWMQVKTLDGMCGVMMVYNTTADANDFPTWMPLLIFLAKEGNYTKIMVSNTTGRKLDAWKKLGFTTVTAFNNRRTGNNVEVLTKDV